MTNRPAAPLRTCLAFGRDGEAAAQFWVSLLPDSRIKRVVGPDPAGTALVVALTLRGAPFMVLNAPVGGAHTPAASISVLTADQAETERLWAMLTDTLTDGDRAAIFALLDGEIPLCEGDGETLLRPGDAATFKAGEAVGHFLENRSAQPVRRLVVGTRTAVDRLTYTERGVVRHRDRAQPEDPFTNLSGAPVGNPFAD